VHTYRLRVESFFKILCYWVEFNLHYICLGQHQFNFSFYFDLSLAATNPQNNKVQNWNVGGEKIRFKNITKQ